MPEMHSIPLIFPQRASVKDSWIAIFYSAPFKKVCSLLYKFDILLLGIWGTNERKQFNVFQRNWVSAVTNGYSNISLVMTIRSVIMLSTDLLLECRIHSGHHFRRCFCSCFWWLS